MSGTNDENRAVQQARSASWETVTLLKTSAATDGAPLLPDLAGSTISHYAVEKLLGRGGMAVVYAARDLTLGRTVALKFLKPTFANDPSHQTRFFREALAVSRLNHANVATIYEVNSETPNQFIALEYVDGGALRGQIGKPFELKRLLDVGIQMVRGLNHAHRRGIVHRDIKPENVMLTSEGLVKIMDFGLARLAEETTITEYGTVLGTLAYMSPEQLMGLPLDCRTDVYSLGVLLFELATGKLPYEFDPSRSLQFQILKGGRTRLHLARPDAPKALARAIDALLAPELEQRTLTLDELETLFDSLQRGAVSVSLPPERAPRPKVAVLPLADSSPEKNHSYFCEGLADEIICLLSRIDEIRVIARSSSFAVGDRPGDVRELGKRLSADYLLDGSLRCAGDRIRVTVQLVSTGDGCQVWSDRYDRQMSDVFEIQEDIATSIVESCRKGLLQGDKLTLAVAASPDVYSAYLKGISELNRQTPEGIRSAIAHFEQAVSSDSGFAPAFAGIAKAWSTLGWYGLASPFDSIPRARRFAEMALSLDGAHTGARCTLAMIKARYDWNWTDARRDFREAMHSAPGAADIHFHFALDCLTPTGQLEEAHAEIEFAWRLDPLSPLLNTAVGGSFYRRRMYDQAVRHLRTSVELAPEFAHGHWSLARAYEQVGDFDSARSAYETALHLSPDNPGMIGEYGGCLGRMRLADEAREQLDRLSRLSSTRYIPRSCAGMVHLGLNEIDDALQAFKQAVQERAAVMTWAATEPRFDVLSKHPRFQNLLVTMGVAGPHQSSVAIHG